jgi:hypothetical protein
VKTISIIVIAALAIPTAIAWGLAATAFVLDQ